MYNWFNSLLGIPENYINSTVQYVVAMAALIMFTCICVLLVEVILSAFVRKRFK